MVQCTIIKAHPSRGANDGFLAAHVATRNHMGITVGAQLFINFGNSYDFTQAKEACSDPDAKRFKGALDVYDDRMNIPSNIDDQQGHENNNGKDEPPPGKRELNFELTLLGEDATLCYQTNPEGTSVLSLNTSFQATSRSTNKRIPPNTILFTCNQIEVKSSNTHGLPWSFEKPGGVHVWMKSGTNTERMTLDKVIQQTMACSVIKHGSFPAGSSPPVLSCQTQCKGLAKEPDARTLLEFAQKLSGLVLEWTVRVNDHAEVVPTGIVITTKKQMIIPTGRAGHMLS